MSDRGGWLRLCLGGLAAAALLAGIALLSRLPMGRTTGDSELRLALRTAAARIEICRDRTKEELAALPAHERAPRICDETPVDYRLTVTIDGEPRLERSIHHRGVRRSRPLAVDEVLRVTPGARRVEVRFEPELAELREAREESGEGESGGKVEHERFAAELEKLASPALAEVVEFEAGRARLLRIGESGALEVAPDPPHRAGG
jgi:hypothetical protein